MTTTHDDIATTWRDLELPADARRCWDWEDGYEDDGSWSRRFVGTERKVGQVVLTICGFQRQDGTAARELNVCGEDFPDADGARHLAAALIEAADEM
jgi:hypothetical protein